MTAMSPNHYSPEELHALGLKRFGDHVLIDRSCRLYGANNIVLGSNVRIDAFCVLSAGTQGISIGDFVHMSTGAAILGTGPVMIEDFVGISAHVCLFSSNDDYTGGAIANPMVPMRYRDVTNAPVTLRRHVVIGAQSVVLAGSELGLGASAGALTLIKGHVPEFTVVAGIPMVRIGKRGRKLLQYEQEIRNAFRLTDQT